tara:strand:- start:6435 stop:8153 length:1719 start_codon:yes stop_codon:yes gene_type:complete
MVYFRLNIKYLTISIILLSGCANFSAYFNTFYNAKEHFDQAESIRKKSENDNISKTALDLYQSSIEKSKYILTEYPDVRFRKDAYLLIIKSHFYRNELTKTNQAITAMKSEFEDESFSEIAYWSALVKWKEGRAQPAINSLIDLSEDNIDISLQSKIYLSIAEIYFEQSLNEKSMDYLELAAEKIKERSEKDQIYFRIAELSFKQNDYPRSLFAYKEVIKNTQIKSRMQLSNLKIVQIYRLQNKYDLASSLIKNMLVDENYQGIYAGLELELAKLYQIQNKDDEYISRLNGIVKDYPRTKESAEASFLLGESTLIKSREFDEALRYYAMVRSEFRSSLFNKSAQLRIKEINAFSKLKNDYDTWIKDASLDTAINIKKESFSNKATAKMLYGIAELEALHFSSMDSALIYIDKLIALKNNNHLLAKALYMKSVILDEFQQSEESKMLKNRLILEFPQSDYAFAILNSDSSFSNDIKTSNDVLIEAEQKWKVDPVLAIDIYKSIVSSDSTSESGLRAAYFLAYNYDYNFIRPDSAKRFYQWIIKHYEVSDQAKSSKARLALISNILTKNSKVKN